MAPGLFVLKFRQPTYHYVVHGFYLEENHGQAKQGGRTSHLGISIEQKGVHTHASIVLSFARWVPILLNLRMSC